MGNWFKRVWNTPGGSASALCLNMLEENNLLIVGRADSCRQQLRESLLYTLLYKSPVRVHQDYFPIPGESSRQRYNKPFREQRDQKRSYCNKTGKRYFRSRL